MEGDGSTAGGEAGEDAGASLVCAETLAPIKVTAAKTPASRVDTATMR